MTQLYKRILTALDSSVHANHALELSIALAGLTPDAKITGIHAVAAGLHDSRFRQMEGGLPSKYRQESALEEQRETHDTLIGHGLNLISDSYLDVGETGCAAAGIPYARLTLEGKNYRVLADEAKRGNYDLLVMGGLGVGAVPGQTIGSVCGRVARRMTVDLWVKKEVANPPSTGPIVVALDGSARAYGGLLTALELGKQWGRAVVLVAAFDPYFHYVVFNNIAGVLSQEGAAVFKFKEQEKLHEEIIDSGLAKIYQAHLDVGASIAKDQGVSVTCELLVGKATAAIEQFLQTHAPSLLVLGKTGIHADEGLDLGWVTETLLRVAPCDLLISCRQHVPEVERVADFTTAWSQEAEARMERIPAIARQMARMAILRYAQEKGHTVITERLVEDATVDLMPAHAHRALQRVVSHVTSIVWSQEAEAMIATLEESVRSNVRLRAEKAARGAKSGEVTGVHVAPFMPLITPKGGSLHWTLEAQARLDGVPAGFMRETLQARIESSAHLTGTIEITLAFVEAELVKARQQMATLAAGQKPA